MINIEYIFAQTEFQLRVSFILRIIMKTYSNELPQNMILKRLFFPCESYNYGTIFSDIFIYHSEHSLILICFMNLENTSSLY